MENTRLWNPPISQFLHPRPRQVVLLTPMDQHGPPEPDHPNPFDGTFSHYTVGRLAAVQYAPVLSGNGQFIDMYNYNIPGQVVTKRLQFNQTVQWSTSIPQTPVVEALNLDAGYTYDNEGAMTAMSYPATVQASQDFYAVQQYVAGHRTRIH